METWKDSDVLISVIVPVYNVKAYIVDCIESIQKQVNVKIEIILVDDGSTDGTSEICESLASKDRRISYFYKENGGVSSARNIGILHAQGKYICFVDSDDMLPVESLDILCSAIEKTDSDFASGRMEGVSEDKSKYDVIVCKEDHKELLRFLYSGPASCSVSKLYKSEIIKTHGLLFNESFKTSEDALFNREYLKYTQRMVVCDGRTYNINWNNSNSLTKRKYEAFGKYYFEILQAFSEMMKAQSFSDVEIERELSKRAIHGIFLCANHYCVGWKDNKVVFEYLNETVKDLAEFVKKDYLMDNKEHRIWMQCHYRQMICNPQQFVRSLVRLVRTERSIKLKIKKVALRRR